MDRAKLAADNEFRIAAEFERLAELTTMVVVVEKLLDLAADHRANGRRFAGIRGDTGSLQELHRRFMENRQQP